MRNRAANLFILASVLILALALMGCGSGVNIGKSISGIWKQESMSAGTASLPTSAMNITLDVKEDGTALLTNGYTGNTVDYTWKADEARKSDPNTVYVVFETGGQYYTTRVNIADSTMLQVYTGDGGGTVEITYRKVS